MERIVFKNPRKLKGIVNEVFVTEGQSVTEGQKLAIISTQGEKYKVLSHKDGIIKSVNIIESLLVSSGDIIFELDVKNEKTDNNKLQTQDKTMRFSLINNNNSNVHNDIPTDENFNLSDTFKFDSTDEVNNEDYNFIESDEKFKQLEKEISEELFFKGISNKDSESIDNNKYNTSEKTKKIDFDLFDTLPSTQENVFNNNLNLKNEDKQNNNDFKKIEELEQKLQSSEKLINSLSNEIVGLKNKVDEGFLKHNETIEKIKSDSDAFLKEKQEEINNKISLFAKNGPTSSVSLNECLYKFNSNIKNVLDLQNILKLKFYTKKMTLNLGAFIVLAVYKALKNESVHLTEASIVHIFDNSFVTSKLDFSSDINLFNVVRSYEEKKSFEKKYFDLVIFDLNDSFLNETQLEIDSKIKVFINKINNKDEEIMEIKFIFLKELFDVNKALRIVTKINYLIENPGFLI